MPVIFTHTQSHTHTHSNHPHSPEHTHVKHNTQLYNIKLQQFILRANHVNFNQHATDNHNHAPLIHTASQQTDNTLSSQDRLCNKYQCNAYSKHWITTLQGCKWQWRKKTGILCIIFCLVY